MVPEGKRNGGSGMPLPHVTNLKSRWSNWCEEYWSNIRHFLSLSKVTLVFLFFSHLLVLKSLPLVEQTALLKVHTTRKTTICSMCTHSAFKNWCVAGIYP
jgi:hypothetical protein